ncbi:set6 [Symbiodinium natans]|uniref:Set6 protein n=1 Tax=Symbiodinium natans TaxID=878477 RepID=A0A812R5Q8_9DINO|nr:set6 [Symbiodinium natans]
MDAVSVERCADGEQRLVAMRHLAMDEVILEEVPLFEMPDEEILERKCSRYVAAWRYACQRIGQDGVERIFAHQFSEGAAAGTKAQEVHNALQLEVPVAQQPAASRFLMVLMSNSFRFTGPKGNRLTALFEIMSRVNHSCLPNARMVGDGHPAKLVTTKSVAPQEEIFLCYGGWNTGFVEQPLRQRQQHLLGNWGFVCQCGRCQQEPRDSKTP